MHARISAVFGWSSRNVCVKVCELMIELDLSKSREVSVLGQTIVCKADTTWHQHYKNRGSGQARVAWVEMQVVTASFESIWLNELLDPGVQIPKKRSGMFVVKFNP